MDAWKQEFRYNLISENWSGYNYTVETTHLYQLNILFTTANRHFSLQKLIESLIGNIKKKNQILTQLW